MCFANIHIFDLKTLAETINIWLHQNVLQTCKGSDTSAAPKTGEVRCQLLVGNWRFKGDCEGQKTHVFSLGMDINKMKLLYRSFI